MTRVPVVPRGGDYCDFCCTPPVFKFYRCVNFSANGNPVFASGLAVGSWAACRTYAELVDQEMQPNGLVAINGPEKMDDSAKISPRQRGLFAGPFRSQRYGLSSLNWVHRCVVAIDALASRAFVPRGG
jgi:hypothetical protein